jgi:transposase
MAGISKILTDDAWLLATKEMKKIGNFGLMAKKLQAIIATKNNTITDVCRVFGISRTTLTGWIKSFKNGYKDLQSKKVKFRKRILNDEQENIVKTWIIEDSNITIDRLQQKIMTTFLVKIARSTVHRLMKKLGFSHVSPRPIHYKKNEEKAAEFIKIVGGKNRK